MRSLFLRIFLSFWGAMSVIGASFALLSASDDQSPRRERFEFLATQALKLESRRSEEHLQRGDPQAAIEQWQALEDKLLIRAQLFSLEELELVSEELPTELVELARRNLSAPQPVWQTFDDFHGFVSALPKSAPTHILVVELPRPKWWDFVFSPSALFSRLLIILFASALLCWALARYIAKPVMHLRDATQRLARGEASVRVGDSLGRRRDELGTLGRDFDTMAQRIENLLAAQRRLLRDVSHELRSPLARLNVALALARKQEREQASEMLDRIERESDRLAVLIGQIMTLTQIDTQGENFRKQLVELPDFLRELVDDADFEAGASDREVTLELGEAVNVHGVPELLRRAIENVVRNAVRHTAKGSAVVVRLERDPTGQAKISVRDHGDGVPEQMLSQIFAPFVRVEEARDRRSGGAGLGLAITDGALRLHEGSVRAENAEGGGLLVTMTLPAFDARPSS